LWSWGCRAFKKIAYTPKPIAPAIIVIAFSTKFISFAIQLIAPAIQLIAPAIKVIASSTKFIAPAIKLIAPAIKLIAVKFFISRNIFNSFKTSEFDPLLHPLKLSYD